MVVSLMMRSITVAVVLIGIFISSSHALASELANCGSSIGYAYYPKIGLAANESGMGQWGEDKMGVDLIM